MAEAWHILENCWAETIQLAVERLGWEEQAGARQVVVVEDAWHILAGAEILLDGVPLFSSAASCTLLSSLRHVGHVQRAGSCSYHTCGVMGLTPSLAVHATVFSPSSPPVAAMWRRCSTPLLSKVSSMWWGWGVGASVEVFFKLKSERK